MGSLIFRHPELLMGRSVNLPSKLFGLRYPNTGAYKLLGGAWSWCQAIMCLSSLVLWNMSATNVYVPRVSCNPPLSRSLSKTSM